MKKTHLYKPVTSHVGPLNPMEHKHWNLFAFGTQLPPFLQGSPAQGSGILCEGGAAPVKKNIDLDENDTDWDGHMGKLYGIPGSVADRPVRMLWLKSASLMYAFK